MRSWKFFARWRTPRTGCLYSSDTRTFNESLKMNVNSLPGDTIQEKLATPEGHAVLEKMLNDPASVKKYLDQLGQMHHTLRKLHEVTDKPLEKAKLEPVLKTLEDARRTGRRLAVGESPVTEKAC